MAGDGGNAGHELDQPPGGAQPAWTVLVREIDGLEHHRRLEDPSGRLANEHLCLTRRPLQVAGHVDRVSGHGCAPRPEDGRHHLSGLDARSDREPDPALSLDALAELAHRPAYLVHGAHGPQGVVFVRGGDDEQADQDVADLLLDARAVPP